MVSSFHPHQLPPPEGHQRSAPADGRERLPAVGGKTGDRALADVGIFAARKAPENYNCDFIQQQLKRSRPTAMMPRGLNGPLSTTGAPNCTARLANSRKVDAVYRGKKVAGSIDTFTP